MSRAEQKDIRRQQILDTSLDLFVRNGYFGTTTKEIADRLNMSQGLFFHYFESKDALYAEHLGRASAGMEFKDLMNNPQIQSMTPLQLIKIMTEAIINSFKDELPAKLMLLVAGAQICTKLPDNIKAIAAEISKTQMMIRLIESGQKIGEIRAGDAAALTGCWFSAIQGVAQTCICFPFVPLPKAEWIVDILKAA